MVLRPVQHPHPPLWYGVSLPDNADWPAQNDVNVISLARRPAVRPIFDRYLSVRRQLGKPDTTLFGVGRHVVVAGQRRASARHRAARLSALAQKLLLAVRAPWRRAARGRPDPESFDDLAALDLAVAGSPRTVRDFVAAEIESTGPNYFVPWLAFGDMRVEEALHSVDLLAGEVIPAFA